MDNETPLQKAADVSQSAQNAVFGPIAKAGDYAARKYSQFSLGSEAPVDLAEKGIGAVTGTI
jgi:hypothetical protein